MRVRRNPLPWHGKQSLKIGSHPIDIDIAVSVKGCYPTESLMSDLQKYLVSPGSSIREVMECIDRNTKGISLVVDEDRKLIGTITDGDIRRAILAGTNLELP